MPDSLLTHLEPFNCPVAADLGSARLKKSQILNDSSLAIVLAVIGMAGTIHAPGAISYQEESVRHLLFLTPAIIYGRGVKLEARGPDASRAGHTHTSSVNGMNEMLCDGNVTRQV